MKKTSYVAMLVVSIIYAMYYLLAKFSFNHGVSIQVFVFYRQAAAALVFCPIIFLTQRTISRPLSVRMCCKAFVLALIGMTGTLNLHAIGIKYTSPGLVVAAGNSLPVLVFTVAFIFRMENVDLRKDFGILKLAGVGLCLAGVATMTLYKGLELKLLLHHHIFSYVNQHQHSAENDKSWIIGLGFVLMANLAWALWMVLQAKVLEDYQSKASLIALQYLFSAIQSFIVAICFERHIDHWKLGWNIELATIAYCAIMVTGVTYYLQTWVLEKNGPVFVGMMSPTGTFITVPASALCFGEVLSLGTVIGTLLIVGGLYSVLWGQAKEKKFLATNDGDNTASSCVRAEDII